MKKLKYVFMLICVMTGLLIPLPAYAKQSVGWSMYITIVDDDIEYVLDEDGERFKFELYDDEDNVFLQEDLSAGEHYAIVLTAKNGYDRQVEGVWSLKTEGNLNWLDKKYNINANKIMNTILYVENSTLPEKETYTLYVNEKKLMSKTISIIEDKKHETESSTTVPTPTPTPKPDNQCSSCGGSGFCMKCDGLGEIECGTCDTYGHCRSCSGWGYKGIGSTRKECSRCGGTGACSRCGYSGFLTCTYCNGSGICSRCDGY